MEYEELNGLVGGHYGMATSALKTEFGETQEIQGEEETVLGEVPEIGTEEYQQLDNQYQVAIDLMAHAQNFLEHRHDIKKFLDEGTQTDKSLGGVSSEDLTEPEQDKLTRMEQRAQFYESRTWGLGEQLSDIGIESYIQ